MDGSQCTVLLLQGTQQVNTLLPVVLSVCTALMQLLSAGLGTVNVPADSSPGFTALGMAVMHGHAATVKQLLGSGGNPIRCTSDPRGHSALHVAAEHGQQQCGVLLIEEG